MQRFLLPLAAAACVQAGVVKGVVLEHITGRAMARTVVRLEAVPTAGGGAVKPLVARSGRGGDFLFASVQPGSYLLTATRAGCFPGAYGQRLPTGRGMPFVVTHDSTLFAEIRMRRHGALTGRVLDENGVGMAGVPVVAYRARLPLTSAGGGTSDDRGVFRIGGLKSGKYVVRSGSYRHEDGSGWLPTFGSHGRELREARIHPVTVDADTQFADVSPEIGALFPLGGTVTCDKPDGAVTITLSSETGERQTQSSCGGSYSFPALAPGTYELLATLPNNTGAAFAEVHVQGRTTRDLALTGVPHIEIEVRRGSAGAADVPVNLTGRRLTPAGGEAMQEIKGPRAALAPGYWELRAHAPLGFYVEAIANTFGAGHRRRPEQAANGFEIFIDQRYPSKIRVSLSDQAARISGRVVKDGQPVIGAPVFVWPEAESARRSLGGAVQLLSDTAGQFRADSLPPGSYRLLASFDVDEVDEDTIEISRAPSVRAEPSHATAIDLPLWVAPY
jgi:hypothetical protein